MGLLSKIRDFEDKIAIKNWLKGYVIDKRIFNLAILLIIILFFCVWSEYDFTNIRNPKLFYECEYPNAICNNDLYDLCNPLSNNYYGGVSICEKINQSLYEKEFLLMGESIGQRPSFLSENFIHIFVLILMFAFIVNHLCYKKNRKFKFNCVEVLKK